MLALLHTALLSCEPAASCCRSSLKKAALQPLLINLRAEETAELLSFCFSDLWEVSPILGSADEAARHPDSDRASACLNLPVSDAVSRVVPLGRNRCATWQLAGCSVSLV